MEISVEKLMSLGGARVSFVTSGRHDYKVRVVENSDFADVRVRVVERAAFSYRAANGAFEWNVVGVRRAEALLCFVERDEDFSVCFVSHGESGINPCHLRRR